MEVTPVGRVSLLPNYKTLSNEEKLMKAAELGDIDEIESLSQADVNVNFQDSDENTALIKAAEKHQAAALLKLVECFFPDIKVNIQNKNKHTAIMFVTTRDEAEALYRIGAKLDLKDGKDRDVFFWQRKFQNHDVVNYLESVTSKINTASDIRVSDKALFLDIVEPGRGISIDKENGNLFLTYDYLRGLIQPKNWTSFRIEENKIILRTEFRDEKEKDYMSIVIPLGLMSKATEFVADANKLKV